MIMIISIYITMGSIKLYLLPWLPSVFILYDVFLFDSFSLCPPSLHLYIASPLLPPLSDISYLHSPSLSHSGLKHHSPYQSPFPLSLSFCLSRFLSLSYPLPPSLAIPLCLALSFLSPPFSPYLLSLSRLSPSPSPSFGLRLSVPPFSLQPNLHLPPSLSSSLPLECPFKG